MAMQTGLRRPWQAAAGRGILCDRGLYAECCKIGELVDLNRKLAVVVVVVVTMMPSMRRIGDDDDDRDDDDDDGGGDDDAS
jgi:hypothetical protein